MTDTYIALLRKEADSDYGVEFPDLPGCVTAGISLDDAAAMAREARSRPSPATPPARPLERPHPPPPRVDGHRPRARRSNSEPS